MNSTPENLRWIAFAGGCCISRGMPREVAAAVKRFVDDHPDATPAVLDAEASRPIDLDLRGTVDAVLDRLPAAPMAAEPTSDTSTADAPRGPGRPKLGVVAREVTLLPRHWEWLARQPGGASVALRKLVESAQRSGAERERRREATESAYRFMHALAGDAPGFEEASRALFAGDLARLTSEVAAWPPDVRQHLLDLAARIATPSDGRTA